MASKAIIKCDEKWRILALAVLALTFFVTRESAGLYAVGWAWMVSQSLYALAFDLYAYRVLDVPVRPAADFIARVLVLAAVAIAVVTTLGLLPPPVIAISLLFLAYPLAMASGDINTLRAVRV